ncbi:MAG: crossover junction endodeoxyribonuclease RuvC [Actinomycetota bacterium]
MRVLGIDPGLTRCGFAIVESGPKALEFGLLKTPAEWQLDQRIHFIAKGIEDLIDNYKPEIFAIEEVFAQQNLRSVMSVAQVSGALIFVAKRAGIESRLITPTAVKSSVAGSGTASKDAVARMVLRHFGLKEAPKPADVADALAVALAALQESQTPARRRWVEAQRSAKH